MILLFNIPVLRQSTVTPRSMLSADTSLSTRRDQALLAQLRSGHCHKLAVAAYHKFTTSSIQLRIQPVEDATWHLTH